jgi:hypothetical protein
VCAELSTPASAEAVETIEDKVHSAAQSGNGLNLPLMRYRYALEGRQRLDTLYEASRAGHVDAVRLLLSYAADQSIAPARTRRHSALLRCQIPGRNHPVSSIHFRPEAILLPWFRKSNQVIDPVPYCGTTRSQQTSPTC